MMRGDALHRLNAQHVDDRDTSVVLARVAAGDSDVLNIEIKSTARVFKAEGNWPAVRAACHELLLETERRISELTGLAPISPPDTFVQAT
jgi:hypothetical protein